MKSPQKENGYTAIANELLEALCRLHLSGNEWSYVHALLRKTYGYNKKEDWITNSQISKMTGMATNRVSEVKRTLVQLSIVTENRNKVSLQKDYSTWGKFRKTGTKVPENRNSEFRKTGYTKDILTKDTYGASEEAQVLPTNKNVMPFKAYTDEPDLPEIDITTGEKIKPKVKKKRTYREVYEVFRAAGFTIPLNWTTNVTQQKCAENLYTERGIENIKNALSYYKEHKGEEYLPEITSPYDLDSKWSKLHAFKKKNG